MSKKLLLIDTFNFLHRAYHALPKTFTDTEGNPTNAIYGVTSMLINIFDTLSPDYAIAALESIEPIKRSEDFADYKAHRKPMEDALAVQIDPVIEVLKSFGIKCLMVNGYEADDVIGTIVKRFQEDSMEIIVASNDRDLWQLTRKNVVIMLPNTKGNMEWLGEKEVAARLGFNPEYLLDYKGLKGDPSDNIPGVPGVGEKTAKSLIAEYGSLENIYAHLSDVAPASLKDKLESGRESAFMSKNLATIVTDIPFDLNLDECRYTHFNKIEVKRVLEKHNFKSLIRRLGFETPRSKKMPDELPSNQTTLF